MPDECTGQVDRRAFGEVVELEGGWCGHTYGAPGKVNDRYNRKAIVQEKDGMNIF